MKKIVLTLFVLHSSFFTLKAQHYFLYGTTQNGKQSGDGVLFRFNPFTGKDTLILNFNGTNGSGSYGSLNLVSNEILYGVCSSGGSQDDGVLFNYNILTNTEDTIVNFTGTNGENPGWGIALNNGILYGITGGGGEYGAGVIVRYEPTFKKDTVVFNFNDTDGSGPIGELFVYNDTSFYGMTVEGGKYDNGVIYRFNPLTKVETTLYNFNGINGAYSQGSLIKDSNGLLYGMTPDGGASGAGVLLSFDPLKNTETTLLDFNDTIGSEPFGTLLLGSDGLLYGMTTEGGSNKDGVLFSYNVSMNKYTVLVNFDNFNGSSGSGSLIEDTINKILYGMTMEGGINNDGVIFRYNLITKKDSVLLNFNDTNGANPYGTLLMVPDSLVRLGVGAIKNSNEEITVYPNPSNGQFTVSLSNINTACIIEVFNVLGEKIYTEPLNLTNNTINLTGQPNGLYLYRVITQTGNLVGEGKLVKQVLELNYEIISPSRCFV